MKGYSDFLWGVVEYLSFLKSYGSSLLSPVGKITPKEKIVSDSLIHDLIWTTR